MTLGDDIPRDPLQGGSPPDDGPGLSPPPAGDDDDRAADLRLARLHLRLGSTGLARAELEVAAAAQPLQGAALLDLAEVRWRTGDLAAAGLAAETWLAAGGAGLLGSVIAVEAAMADGRPSDARRHLESLPQPTPEAIDAAFNGMPRSAVWPQEEGPGPATLGATFDDEAFTPAGAGHGTGRPAESAMDPVATLDAARAILEAGDVQGGAVGLSVVLRLAPHLAPAVLDVLDGVSGPMAELVRGDAYRLVGRETEAERSWLSAAADVSAPLPPRSRRSGKPAGRPSSVAFPPDTRAVFVDPAREPGAAAPDIEEIP